MWKNSLYVSACPSLRCSCSALFATWLYSLYGTLWTLRFIQMLRELTTLLKIVRNLLPSQHYRSAKSSISKLREHFPCCALVVGALLFILSCWLMDCSHSMVGSSGGNIFIQWISVLYAVEKVFECVCLPIMFAELSSMLTQLLMKQRQRRWRMNGGSCRDRRKESGG